MQLKLLHAAARIVGGLLFATQVAAQVVHAPILVGDDPRAVAVNPATGKAYVANFGTNTVTMVDGTLAVKTITVGSRPEYVAVNPETGAVFTANQGDGTMSVIDADSDAVRSSSAIQVGGQIAINPYTDHAFILRDSSGDEVNIVSGDTFQYAIATRAHIPLSLALNGRTCDLSGRRGQHSVKANCKVHLPILALSTLLTISTRHCAPTLIVPWLVDALAAALPFVGSVAPGGVLAQRQSDDLFARTAQRLHAGRR